MKKLKCLWCETLQGMYGEDFESEDCLSRSSLTAVYNKRRHTDTYETVNLANVIVVNDCDKRNIEINSHLTPHMEDFIVLEYGCDYASHHTNVLEIRGDKIDYYIDSRWLKIVYKHLGDVNKEEYLELNKVTKEDPSNILIDIRDDEVMEDADEDY